MAEITQSDFRPPRARLKTVYRVSVQSTRTIRTVQVLMDLIRIDVTIQKKWRRNSVGTFVNFVWVTIGEKIFSDHISVKKAGKELKPTGMVIK